jgi:thiamine biosynthesis lipoprotein
MTTPCEVHIFLNDEPKARMIAGKILAKAKALEKKYNFYDPNSLLSAINRREVAKLDVQTEELLKQAGKFYVFTNAIFDVTMGTLVKARKLSSVSQIEEEIERLTPFVGCEHFKIHRHKIIFDNPYTQIDLGGFVKEYAVDMAVTILKKYKIESALVNFGGDIYALGAKPSGEPFSIGIKNPKNPQEYLMDVKLENQALTTSASYERNHKVEEQIYSHIITPHGLQEEIVSATVLAPTTLESGVYSTALMVEPMLPTKLDTLLINKSLILC